MRPPRSSNLLLILFVASWLASCSAWKGRFQGEEDGVRGRIVVTRFAGNDSISDFMLGRQIQATMEDLSKDPSQRALAYDAALDLEAYYRRQGFPEVEIRQQLEVPEDEKLPLALRFEIREGPRVLVTRMRLTGMETETRETLLGFWERSQTGMFGTGHPVYVEDDIDGFVQTLRAYYLSKGHLDVEVEGPEIEREEGGTTAEVSIRIQEGPLYTIRSIELPKEVAELLGGSRPKIPEGQPYSIRFRQEWRARLGRMLRNLGYYRPVFGRYLARKIEGTQEIEMRLPVKTGPKVRVGEIQVRGQDQTQAAFIKGKYRTRLGELFSSREEDDAVTRLYGTGLFRKVEVEYEELDEDRIRVTFVVEENESGAVDVMVGWGSWDKLRGGVKFEEKNLFGSGLGFTADVLASMRGYHGRMTFSDADLWDSGTRLNLSGKFFRNERPSFTEEAFETNLAGTRYFLERYKARLGYQFKKQLELIAHSNDPLVPEQEADKGAIFAELGRDERDNVLFPHEGWQAHARYDFNNRALGGDVDFQRLTLKLNGYLPVSRTARFVLSGEVGALWPMGGFDDVPISERFFNGGASTVRSYREDQIGPRTPDGNARGGQFRTVWKAEFRARVFGPLEFAIFADAGNVGTEVRDFGLRDMRYGIGPGFIIVTPAIPIRVDAGFNPDRRDGEEEWVVHLTIGHGF